MPPTQWLRGEGVKDHAAPPHDFQHRISDPCPSKELYRSSEVAPMAIDCPCHWLISCEWEGHHLSFIHMQYPSVAI